MNKKNFCFFNTFILFLIVITFLFSCSLGKKEQEISVALFQAPASEALISLIPNFQNETGIKVKYEILPYAGLKAKVEQQFFAKSSNYDVVMADCIWIPSFAKRGCLGELDTKAYKADTYDYEDILPALDDYLGRYPQGGTRYGMPFMSNTHMMAFRPEIVKPVADSLGLELPGQTSTTAWTWQQYLQVAQELTKQYKDSKPQVFGTSLQARAGAWLVYEWYSELFGFVDNAKARITGLPVFDESAAKAMEYYAKLYQAAPQESLTWGHEEETSAICSGKCAMDATSNVELAANLISTKCNKYGPIRFSYPPVGLSGRGSPDMGGYGLLLSKFSKNQSNASAFILWAASKDIHKNVVLNGGSPIRMSEIKNPEILKKYPYLMFYDKLIQDSVYRARIPEWPELQDIISRELTSVMKGEQKAQKAVKGIQSWLKNNGISIN